MSRGDLWKVSIPTTSQAEEAAMNLLDRVFGQSSWSYTDYDTGETKVACYLSRKPHDLPAKRDALESALSQLKASGLALGSAKISLTRVAHRNWAEAWKHHFKPIQVGAVLLIRPSWIRQKAKGRQQLIVLDPGLSFGTGQHPTTLFCLHQIAAYRDVTKNQSCLDVGTGSGILALAAARLGYTPIEGLDHDPEAIRAARTNARVNRLGKQIRFRLEDLSQLPRCAPRRHSLICANLLAPLLVELRDHMLELLAPDGLLVMAGILRLEFRKIRASYEGAGLQLVKSQTKAEWQSGAWTWQDKP